MADERPKYKEFIGSLVQGWGQSMSGPAQVWLSFVFSVFVLAVGVFSIALKSIEGLLTAGLVGLGALHLTCYKLWAKERYRVVDLQERLVPTVKCSFTPTTPGCVRPNTVLTIGLIVITDRGPAIQNVSVRGTYFRIAVNTTGVGSVPKCTGFLTSIRRNSYDWVDGENLLLTFAPAEDADSTEKLLRAGVPAYLDFLFIGDDNKPRLTTKDFKGPSSVNYDTMFSTPADYLFHIIISSPESVLVTQDIFLHWTGDRNSSQVTALSTNN